MTQTTHDQQMSRYTEQYREPESVTATAETVDLADLMRQFNELKAEMTNVIAAIRSSLSRNK
jgi:cell fate (sporulation/competence/biofilm development) regulator YlbF (YheA/YmcA/DUF963 family)